MCQNDWKKSGVIPSNPGILLGFMKNRGFFISPFSTGFSNSKFMEVVMVEGMASNLFSQPKESEEENMLE